MELFEEDVWGLVETEDYVEDADNGWYDWGDDWGGSGVNDVQLADSAHPVEVVAEGVAELLAPEPQGQDYDIQAQVGGIGETVEHLELTRSLNTGWSYYFVRHQPLFRTYLLNWKWSMSGFCNCNPPHFQ